MRKAKIILTSQNHEELEKSYRLHTIYGDTYAPKSVTQIREGIAYIPCWIFWRVNLNECQMVEGFIETINE